MRDHSALLAGEIEFSLGLVFVTLEVEVVGVMAGDGIALQHALEAQRLDTSGGKAQLIARIKNKIPAPERVSFAVAAKSAAKCAARPKPK